MFAVGSANGSVSAGRDASLAAYGSINTTVTAGRDISDIWSGGSIAGSFSALNNISGGVYSYGSISANFTAMGTLGDPTTGIIGLTHAAGGIGGAFSGTNQVMDLFAGGSITAIVTSASIGGLFAFDSSMAGATTPTPPPNPASDILAALATARSGLNTQVNNYNGSTSAAYLQAVSDLATQQSDATTSYANALANAQSDLTTSNSTLRTDANNDYTTSQAAAIAGINAALLAAANEWASIQSQVAQQLAAASSQNAAESLAAGNKIAALSAGLTQATTALNVARNAVSAQQNQAFLAANAEIAAYPEITWQAMKTWAIDLAQAMAATVAEYLNYVPYCPAQMLAQYITWANIAIDLLQGQYDQAIPALIMAGIFGALFGTSFCFTPETPLHLEPMSGIDGDSRAVFLRPQVDDHDAEYLVLGLLITAAGTFWIRQREERKKRLADFREQDSLFNGSRFDELCRGIDAKA